MDDNNPVSKRFGKLGRRQFVQAGVALGLGLGSAGAAAASAEDADYYVAPDGSDSNSGTEGNPFESVEKAVSELSSGELAYIRDGTYDIDGTVAAWRQDGSESSPVRLEGYPGERPVLESGRLRINESSHWHIRNLEIRNSDHNGVHIDGPNADGVVVENVVSHHNELNGIQLVDVDDGVVRNCTTYSNADEGNGGKNADGIHLTNGSENCLVENCDVYWNSDDGIDLGKSENVTVSHCRVWENGFDESGNDYGNPSTGIKFGTLGDNGGHLVHHNVVWGNKRGIDRNGAEVAHEVYNNTSFDNEWVNYRFMSASDGSHELVNNVSYEGDIRLKGGDIDDRRNTWNLGIDDPGFGSTDSDSSNFVTPESGSSLVDAGVSVLSNQGSDPDLGAVPQSGDPDGIGASGDGDGGSSSDSSSEPEAESSDSDSDDGSDSDGSGSKDGGESTVLTVNGHTDTDETAHYEFAVSGDVEQTDAYRASVNDHDDISDSTVDGHVGGWRDSFRFTGSVTDFEFTEGEAEVLVDGDAVDPGDLG